MPPRYVVLQLICQFSLDKLNTPLTLKESDKITLLMFQDHHTAC